jgi:hypothetical protein
MEQGAAGAVVPGLSSCAPEGPSPAPLWCISGGLQLRTRSLSARRSNARLLAPQSILDATRCVLSLALGLVGPPLCLELGVTEHVADAFLDRALGLLG